MRDIRFNIHFEYTFLADGGYLLADASFYWRFHSLLADTNYLPAKKPLLSKSAKAFS
ncbi:hypothetical protein [Neobacillus bataviensis]|uniref:hypothetical protein n=1 Tax=Neobacillus bataviensis TaxID=220685 RepID=UPI00164818DE|nr:hypothetical protein [Neobacillus bataviensis]